MAASRQVTLLQAAYAAEDAYQQLCFLLLPKYCGHSAAAAATAAVCAYGGVSLQ
jgi:hypothetical protein